MQQVNFFLSKWISYSTDSQRFYIYDRNDSTAVVLTDDAAVHEKAVNVSNPSAKHCWLLPIDHNVDIRKDGSSDFESTCDYLLSIDGFEQIIFGEIKNQRRGWESDGIKQLKKTIAIFKANHDINNWQVKKAYVSNYHKWNARSSTMAKQDQFKDETNIRLYIQNDVEIDKEF